MLTDTMVWHGTKEIYLRGSFVSFREMITSQLQGKLWLYDEVYIRSKQSELQRSLTINTAGASVNTACVSVNTAVRSVNTAGSKPTVNHPRSISNGYKRGYSQLLDESQVLLRVPRKDNIYSVDLKSVVPTKGLTCLFVKATMMKSDLWHRRCDNGTEFKNSVMNQFCEMKRIKREFSVARTPSGRLVLLRGGKFEGKSDEGFFIGYSVVNKAMRVFNKRTRIVEETLNVRFLENTPNVTGNRSYWLFDVNSLTISMNYVPKTEPEQEYILIPICTTDPLISQDPKQTVHPNNTNSINIVSTPVSAAGPSFTNDDPSSLVNAAEASNAFEEHLFERFSPFKNAFTLPPVSNSYYSHLYWGSPKDHPKDQIIGDFNSAIQTRRMTKISKEHAMVTQESDSSSGRSKLDRSNARGASTILTSEERDCVRNKAKTGCTRLYQKKEIDYDEVFAPVARIEANHDPQFPDKVYKVEKALYGLHQAPRACTSHGNPNKAMIKDEEADSVDVHLYRSMIGSLMYLTASRPDIMFVVCACARFQVTPKVSHLHAVKRIFRYLKGQPKLGLWYPRDSPFNLEAFSDSDYVGASLDRKSTTGGCQFLGKRLISWQCKKQTIVANSTTEAEYVAAANCCGQVLWIQNQMLDYGFNFMNTKIFIDNESTICIVKNPVFHSKTKHIEIRHHFIRDCYEKKLIQVIKIHTDHNVADLLTKAFDEWEGDKMERAATTASSLDAEQDSGSGPRCQDTILGGADAQTRFETASKQSNDPPLLRGYTLGSGEDITAAGLLNVVRHNLVLPVQVNAAEGDFINTSIQGFI
ncbi:hypothetical protein Tco_0963980 [Tanacetum coccineum]